MNCVLFAVKSNQFFIILTLHMTRLFDAVNFVTCSFSGIIFEQFRCRFSRIITFTGIKN